MVVVVVVVLVRKIDGAATVTCQPFLKVALDELYLWTHGCD